MAGGLTRDQRRVLVGGVLRLMREERGIRQEDIAIRIGYPQSYVSKYETGQRSLDIIEVSAVCEALGVSLLEFARRLQARLTP